MFEVQREGIGRALKDLLGIRQRFNVTAEQTVLPVINAWNLDDPPYSSKRGGVYHTLITPAAGQYACVSVSARAGTIVVVRYAVAGESAGTPRLFSLEWAEDAAVAALPLAPAMPWDPDLSFSGGAPVVREGSIAATGAFWPFWERDITPAWGRSVVPGPFVVRPGISLLIEGSNANGIMGLGFYADVYEE